LIISSTYKKVSVCLLLHLILLFLAPPVKAQNNQDSGLEDTSKWYFGPVVRLDELKIDNSEDETASGLNYYGLRLFHRMSDHFATGANILFSPEHSSFSIDLDSRWIWSLPIFEPYIGVELAYLTRSSGGLNLAPKLGVLIELEELPILFDLHLLGRYDVTAVIFENAQSHSSLNFGVGASIQYRL